MAAANPEMIGYGNGWASLTDFLDEVIPLRNASHADVVSYLVDIPMRYAECFAKLRDGRRVSLRDRRQLVGWKGYRKCRSLLFRSGGLELVLDVDETDTAWPVRDMYVQAETASVAPIPSRDEGHIRKFVGIDGSLVLQTVA